MAAVSNVRYAAWEDTIIAWGKDRVYLKELTHDPKLKIVSGSITVRGENDDDKGPSSDILESLDALFKKHAGFRLKSAEGMDVGDRRVWVSISFTKD